MFNRISLRNLFFTVILKGKYFIKYQSDKKNITVNQNQLQERMFNSRNEREREREVIISSEYSFKSCYEFIIRKRIEYINAPKGN